MRLRNTNLVKLVILVMLLILNSGCSDDDNPTTTPFQTTGTVVIKVLPIDLTATWTLSGPNKADVQGMGNQTFTEQELGEYSITWDTVIGYVTPANIPLTLAGGQTITFEGTYGSNPVYSAVVLSDNLEYPKGLFVDGNRVYFTETAGRNTSFGGKIRLSYYDLDLNTTNMVADNPTNSDAIVVASNGLVYLASYTGSSIGDLGGMSVIDPATGIETELPDVEIGATDMWIDGNDNITLLGQSHSPSAKSMYYFPALDFANPTITQTGLGAVWCLGHDGTTPYYSTHDSTFRIGSNGTPELFLDESFMSLSLSDTHMFYADYFSETVGVIDLGTMQNTIMVSGLDSPPIRIRYDDASQRIFVVVVGTSADFYRDGALLEIITQ
ncbi:MAG: hypothetical protein GY780_06140 [bacterium]|nr:hypothetical protein [bacterium]